MKNHGYTVLFIDDEENILSALKRVLRAENYTIFTARNGSEGLEILKEKEINLVICDQRIPEMSGTEFLAAINNQYPDVVRIILSGSTDVDTITESINKGHVYKYLLKPWNEMTLKMEIKQAFEYYELKQANKMLNQNIALQNEKLKKYNESLEDMVKSRTEELIIKNHVLELSRYILEHIPIPIIGISEEGTVVLMNEMAGNMCFSGRHITVGNEIADCFDSRITQLFNDCLRCGEPQHLQHYQLDQGNEDTCDINFTPLKGDLESKGVIISLKLNSV